PTTAQPKNSATYTAEASTDLGSDIDTASAEWQFQDRVNGRDVIKKKEGVRVSYTWRGSGARPVVFTVKDRAGNESLYRFNSFVEDTVHPAVSFSLRPPAPGAHRLLVVVKASESVHLRLLVTQVGRRKPLLRRSVDFWGEASHRRSIPLLGGVGKGILVITGVARDLAGNTTSLPQCVIDPVSGQGNCAAP
ncbi:MAG: hypothetical protein QOI71_70, partial [Gaiellales bacterium]|nr:hypothetical protein [Gaiellales bacterium]